jgi:hypothetical protein
MLLRAFTLSILAGAVFLAASVGANAQAAKKQAASPPPPRCMEAVVPKCTPASLFYCTKKAKCGSCAKWTCGSFGPKRT